MVRLDHIFCEKYYKNLYICPLGRLFPKIGNTMSWKIRFILKVLKKNSIQKKKSDEPIMRNQYYWQQIKWMNMWMEGLTWMRRILLQGRGDKGNNILKNTAFTFCQFSNLWCDKTKNTNTNTSRISHKLKSTSKENLK